MMNKVLYVATVVKTHINTFHLPFLEMFKNEGWETSVCARNDFENLTDCHIPYCDKFFDTPFERFPFKPNNFKAFLALRRIIKREQFDIIHCHTPSGGVLARLAAIGTKKKGSRIMYTAHGFHFFKGAPLINWLIYFPIEWVCSFFTDTLITINKEDYSFAKKHMHAKDIEYIPGIGVDVEKYKRTKVDSKKKREELGIPSESFAILSVGELNDNKNHEVVLRAIAEIGRKDMVYVICGEGDKHEYLKNLANELGVSEQLFLLGYRNDIPEINKACDVYAFPSKREGLSLALLEAMAAGLPCVVSEIRGNRDLIDDGKNGYLCNPMAVDKFAEKISALIEDVNLRTAFSESVIKSVEKFSIENSNKLMKKIYSCEIKQAELVN